MVEAWPALDMDQSNRAARDTLHMWTQVVGKIRLAQSPLVNHWWNVPLYVTPRGLTTSAIPHREGRTFRIDFDFISHQLQIQTNEGETIFLALTTMTVAEFYYMLMEALESMEVPVSIRTMPQEIPDPIPFEMDTIHHAYNPSFALRHWRILASASGVLERFRAGFNGKCSPVHFFWGGFDLAVTRFSGRTAPEHGPVPFVPLSVVREAYSHEVSSCGFWAGGGPIAQPSFYSYAYPEPPGFKDRDAGPGAYYHADMGEFILPYEYVRKSDDPEGTLTAFLQATYEAAAGAGGWDRNALERKPRSYASGVLAV